MYQYFIGIDISKNNFVTAQYGQNTIQAFENTSEGYQAFFTHYEAELAQSLVVLETTGGYEMALIHYLLDKQVKVHRANARKVKYFIRSLGKEGKSDAIDTAGLAQYGFERHRALSLFVIKPGIEETLQQLVQRQLDLKKILGQEENRRQTPNQLAYVTQSCEQLIQFLEKQLKELNQEIQSLIHGNAEQKQKQQILQGIAGIGPTISTAFLALLPELGRINRRQIASLVGVAPHPCESGQALGYRRTKAGRPRCALHFIYGGDDSCP